MRINIFIFCLIFIFIFMFFSSGDHAVCRASEKKQTIFTTWKVFEVDKCASIWLIKRFINKDAVIRVIPRGETAEEGILFDMPDAKFKRTFNLSTYESFLRHYKLKDPKLIQIGRIVHDVEINTWGRKKFPETRMIMEAINAIIMSIKDSDEIIAKSLEYFDSLYLKM